MKWKKPPRPTDESSLPTTAYPSPPKDTSRLDKSFGLEKSANRLPIASEATVNSHMWNLLWSHKRGFLWVAVLQLLTTSAALIPPRAFGGLLEDLKNRPDATQVKNTVYIVIAALLLQSVFVYFT
ncbi:MAG: hypothetical protein RL288_993, partial [Actinomycetota bacterium]